MTPLEARRIVDALAQGQDPETGVPIADATALLQRPQVIRALFFSSRALTRMIAQQEASSMAQGRTPGRRQVPAAPQPGRSGSEWTPDEEKALARLFQVERADMKRMCSEHQRSSGAVANRLLKLGLIDEESELWKRFGRSAGALARPAAAAAPGQAQPMAPKTDAGRDTAGAPAS